MKKRDFGRWWSFVLGVGLLFVPLVIGAAQTPEAENFQPALSEDGERGYTDTYPGKLVPFAGMGTAAIIVWLVMAMVKSSDRQRHESIRKYLEKGVEVPWELLVDSGDPQTWRPVSDLRKALIWLAIGLGLGLTAYVFSGSPKALAVGLVFDFIGIGYLIVWKLEPTPVEGSEEPSEPRS